MRVKSLALLGFSLLLAVGFGLTAGCAAQKTETLPRLIKNVTAWEAYTLIPKNQQNTDFVILDIRTPQEFAEGHIAGAINLDFYSPAFADNIDKLDRGKTYLLYCRSGSRSLSAFERMKKLNFTRIYHLAGGILEWQADGLPVVKQSSSRLGTGFWLYGYRLYGYRLTQTNPPLL